MQARLTDFRELTAREITGFDCIFSFKKMHLKMQSGKWRPSCLSINVLKGSTRSQAMECQHDHWADIPFEIDDCIFHYFCIVLISVQTQNIKPTMDRTIWSSYVRCHNSSARGISLGPRYSRQRWYHGQVSKELCSQCRVAGNCCCFGWVVGNYCSHGW